MEPPDRLNASLINRILDLGRRRDLESPDVLDSFKDLQSYDWINRLAWTTWDNAAADLSVEETASLARALATMEQGWKWSGGSVAAVIWVFRNLQRRDPQLAGHAARWLVKHSSNPWVPFGRQSERSALKSQLEVERLSTQNSEREQTLRISLGALALERKKEQWLRDELAAHQRWQDACNERDRVRREREVRLLERRRRREAQFERYCQWRTDTSHDRQRLIDEACPLSPETRLQLIANQRQLPVDCFPPDWAEVEETTIGGLPAPLVDQLLQRFSRRPKGSWRDLKRKLEQR